ncbi:MAG: DNA mismatch repair endonuclease MutL [Clostridia bacterium]|nr:DNA mismatch repair endonuclease MutL [Clostridia bacterium]
MPKINVLPKSVAELIAAGEVVERPASVVKELVENSLDAGATAITVEIRGGGIEYIRVTDNGCGIAREDVRTAFISHATSKIGGAEDLNAILTLGFRGEALPSVCSVARIHMLTRTAEEAVGTAYAAEGGEELSLDDAGCPVGTTVTVRDLFYNTPARMKFLKKDIAEGTYVADAVAKAALSHPDVRFSFIKNGKQTLATPGGGDLYSAVYAVFGKDVAGALIPCEYEYNNIRITGFISRPLNNRPNRNMQYFYVNGRFVRIPAAVPALDEAYKNRIMVGKFPMCFLFLTIPADRLDVNVHPAKTEVRFSDERAIFETVYYAAKSALNKGDTLRPGVELKRPAPVGKPVPQGEQMRMPRAEMPVRAESGERRAEMSARAEFSSALRDVSSVFAGPENTADKPSETSAEKAEQYKPSESPDERVGNDVAADQSPLSALRSPNSPDAAEAACYGESPNSALRSPLSEAPSRVDYAKAFSEASAKKVNIDIVCDEPEYRIVGEVFSTYIIVERGDKLLLIDKHAAHERIIFNSLSKNSGASQLLLAPVQVTLSAREYAAVLDNLEVLSQAGYAVEDFGGSTVIVRECPVLLEQEDIASLVAELAGELAKGNLRPTPEKLEWLWDSTACRAAVKAGKDLKPADAEALVKRLLTDESVRYCPHGRPVIYELSRHELEKQFGRLG